MRIRLFISHSDGDRGLAKAITALMQYGCKLSDDEIRCTSVDGFRLQSGSNVDAELRDELRNADYMIGILSDVSVESFYVLAEFGARWGTAKPLATLKASTMQLDAFAGPLKNLSLTPIETAPQVAQILKEAQRHLGSAVPIDPQKVNGYAAQVIDQNNKLKIRPPPLQITKAFWGTADKSVDVTQRLSSLIREGGVAVYADNDLAWAEPAFGLRKQLKVEALVKGTSVTKTFEEGDLVLLP